MGFEVERFLVPPPKELVCLVCKGVFEDPVQGSCGHVYCSKCRIQSDPWNYDDLCPVSYNARKRSLDLGRGHEIDARPVAIGHGRAIHSSNIVVAQVFPVIRGHGPFVNPNAILGSPPNAHQLGMSRKALDIGDTAPGASKPCERGVVQIAEPLKATLNKLRIKCKYFEDCSWVGSMADLAGHEASCSESVVRQQIENKYKEIRELKKKLIQLRTTGQD